MQSINFDEGYKKYAINGDKSRVIKINPSDVNLLSRCEKAMAVIEKERERLLQNITLQPDGTIAEEDQSRPEALDALNSLEQIARNAFNEMFNGDVYDTIFAGQSPFSIVGDGKYLLESFVESFIPIIEKDLKASMAASEKRMGKYTAGYKKK